MPVRFCAPTVKNTVLIIASTPIFAIIPESRALAGAGATVPLTGFGNTLAAGVKEAVDSDGFLGIFIGGLKASAGGITVAITAGLLASLIFKAKDKS